MLVAQPAGSYRFVPGNGELPFCNAVIADSGYEIVRAQFERPLPWREGFRRVEEHLRRLDRRREALCAVELRCAVPYTTEAFAEFNAGYADLLRGWGLFLDGLGTTARTNVAPEVHPPAEQSMFAFAYTVPAANVPISFVVSGSPERDGVRPGETSADAVREKTADVAEVLTERLVALDRSWADVGQVAVYTPHDALAIVQDQLLARMGPAAANGLRWFASRPPIIGDEMEIDVRTVRHEIRLTVQ